MVLSEIVYGAIDWLNVARDKNRWWMLVTAVMNFRVL
jgi:hypothetical protein